MFSLWKLANQKTKNVHVKNHMELWRAYSMGCRFVELYITITIIIIIIIAHQFYSIKQFRPFIRMYAVIAAFHCKFQLELFYWVWFFKMAYKVWYESMGQRENMRLCSMIEMTMTTQSQQQQQQYYYNIIMASATNVALINLTINSHKNSYRK